MQLFAKWSFNWLLMGRKNILLFFPCKFNIIGRHIQNFNFSSNFDVFSLLNLLSWLEVLAIWRQISSSSISYSFGDTLNWKPWDNKSWIPKFEHSYFSSNFNTVFCKINNFMGYWWKVNKFCYFTLKRGLKGAKILKFCVFGRYIEVLFFQFWYVFFSLYWFCFESFR